MLNQIFGFFMRVCAEEAPLTADVAAGAEQMSEVNILTTLMPFVLMFVAFYFILIRPQRKRDKQTRDMLNALKLGDEVITVGGIYGKISSIKDDTLVIDVGADKTKLRIARWAVKDLGKA